MLTEGEKAADTLRTLPGLEALPLGTVTGAQGCPCDDSLKTLLGRKVYLWPDLDEEGLQHMNKIAAALGRLGVETRRIQWAGARDKGDDAADFIARGGTAEDLQKLLAEATKEPRMAEVSIQGAAETDIHAHIHLNGNGHAPKGRITSINSVNSSPPKGWEEPVPFDEYDVPPFPVEALPPWLADWVKATAEATQTPEDLAAVVSLSILSTACAKRIEVRAREGWQEPVNLYTLVSLPSGEKKSPVFRAALEPLREFEAELRESYKDRYSNERTAYDVAEAAWKKAKDEAARANDPAAREVKQEEANRLGREFGAMKKPVYPQLTCDNVTVEKLASMLSEQRGRLALLSAEGGLFDTLAGRYSDGVADLDTVLKAYSGEPIQTDRMTRQGERTEQPALTLGLTVQPDVLAGLSEKKEFRGRGLLARFLFSIPKSRVGSRNADPAPVPPQVRDSYSSHVKAILSTEERLDSTGEPIPVIASLDAVSHAVLCDYQRGLEPRLREGEELGHMADWGNKLPGHLLRVVGLLHVADHTGGTSVPATIGVETMTRAVVICEYLLAHAKAAYGEIGAVPGMSLAKKVLRQVKKENWERFTRTELLRAVRVQPAKELDAPLDHLHRHGFIRPVLEGDSTPGPGRRATEYEVNPLAINGINGKNSGQQDGTVTAGGSR